MVNGEPDSGLPRQALAQIHPLIEVELDVEAGGAAGRRHVLERAVRLRGSRIEGEASAETGVAARPPRTSMTILSVLKFLTYGYVQFYCSRFVEAVLAHELARPQQAGVGYRPVDGRQRRVQLVADSLPQLSRHAHEQGGDLGAELFLSQRRSRWDLKFGSGRGILRSLNSLDISATWFNNFGTPSAAIIC